MRLSDSLRSKSYVVRTICLVDGLSVYASIICPAESQDVNVRTVSRNIRVLHYITRTHAALAFHEKPLSCVQTTRTSFCLKFGRVDYSDSHARPRASSTLPAPATCVVRVERDCMWGKKGGKTVCVAVSCSP